MNITDDKIGAMIDTGILESEVAQSASCYEISPNRPYLDKLDALVASNDFIRALRQSAELADVAGRSPKPAELVRDLCSFADDGAFQTLLVIESLAVVRDDSSDEALIDFLSHPAAIVRRHASWRLGRRLPTRRALTPLLAQLAVGGIDTMHAHRTLRQWAAVSPQAISAGIDRSLAAERSPDCRARLVDLLGAIDGPTDTLIRVAADPDEASSARIAAIGALGEQAGAASESTLLRLARADDEIGTHAALALHDLTTADIPSSQCADGGLRLAQLVLAGGLDGQLSLGGRGETGGVASLLVSLGEALARRDDVDHVLTIGRGSVADAMTASVRLADTPSDYGMIAVGNDGRPADSPNDDWEHLPTIERGLRRVLRLSRPIDLLHLRMADVGTLAGANVAAAMKLPICFSVAPDPHNVVHSMQTRRELDQESFLRLDRDSHVWFRARLVERLTRNADRLALFPRVQSAELAEILGVDICGRGDRAAVVAEGIDVDLIRRADERGSGRTNAAGGQRDVLDDLADRIPADRRHLPLLLSVGRLHPIKGMDRVVASWATDPTLREMCNLVIVGGDLAQPSATERSVLDAIDREVPNGDPRRAGLVLLGGRPRADVARLLVATANGRDEDWSAGGVYVDGALKEEFGLALIEALAAGLVVTAPSTGGPATYVDHGDTGVLVAPDADLGLAVRDAFALVERPGRAQRARTMVEARYSIETMASQLTDLYRPEAALL
jgi:glycosyltransferase involved in cell wall biosynthesis